MSGIICVGIKIHLKHKKYLILGVEKLIQIMMKCIQCPVDLYKLCLLRQHIFGVMK